MNASSGDFVDWRRDLVEFGWSNLIAFVMLPLIRVVMDRLIIPGHSLGRDIRDDGNVAAGLLEGTCAIAFAIVLAVLL